MDARIIILYSIPFKKACQIDIKISTRSTNVLQINLHIDSMFEYEYSLMLPTCVEAEGYFFKRL